jgi:hypothetical protein
MPTAVEEFPPALSDAELREVFATLVAEWKRKSRFMSDTRRMVVLEPYQRIIGLGRPAVPLLLEELQREPGWWFWALEAITGQNPIPPGVGGQLEKMTDAWLEWGRKRRLV